MSGIISGSTGSNISASESSSIHGSENSDISASKLSGITGTSHAAVIASEGALASQRGELARANGFFDSMGDAQTSNFILKGFVPKNSPGSPGSHELVLRGTTGPGGAEEHFVLSPQSTYFVTVKAAGSGMTGGVGSAVRKEGLITTSTDYVYTVDINNSFDKWTSDNVMIYPNVSVVATWLWFTVEVDVFSKDTRWVADVSLTKVSY